MVSDTPRTTKVLNDVIGMGGTASTIMLACHAMQLERELAEARRTINEITGPLVLCGEAEVRDVQGFREKIIAMREAMIGYRQELAEARRELEVWSRRYADLEVLYLAALKS